ncbi:tetratricopeptide repeat protein [Streptomyces sp. NPDC059515]|uniref:tetratricopeptide repeat protein n=1 Tax=Streptomyces sp. NPDC059515 TaxID=3346854 RepID=UPI0036C37A5C
MARLSREMKREQQAAHTTHRAAEPIEVRIPAAGEGADAASVGGVPVAAAPGEEVQQAVLDRLQRMALASGQAVLATVRDERIGYVVPLRVEPDGSSHFTADPAPLAPPASPAQAPIAPASPPALPAHASDAPASPLVPPAHAPIAHAAPAPLPVPSAAHRPVAAPGTVPGPGDAAVPPGTGPGPGDAAVPPGTVLPPTGTFGPPPVMDAEPHPAVRDEVRRRAPEPFPDPAHDPDGRPAPPRGFDAVAEAVLGDEPLGPSGGALAEPVARISDAVREGRLDPAARLAGQTVSEATAALGPEHPEVLGLRELTAYIDYLAGRPEPALRTCLDLAAIHRRAGDAEAAYSSVRGAATAWRAVRDPHLGLELGRELVGLWAELAADEGPAADEPEELDSARARMDRLTARARARQD